MWRKRPKQYLPEESLTENCRNIEKQIKSLFESIISKAAPYNSRIEGDRGLQILRNSQWLSRISATEFFLKYGGHYKTHEMLGHEGMRLRTESNVGLSFKELAYQVFQSIDFLHLFNNYGVNTQIGGSDQWGNISSGLHLINKIVQNADALGVTLPLLKDKSGKKIGKSDGAVLWLDRNLTSPFDLYHYIYNLDKDVLRQAASGLTFLPDEHISHMFSKDDNMYQGAVAREIISTIYDDETANFVYSLPRMFSGTTAKLSLSDCFNVLLPNRAMAATEERFTGKSLLQILEQFPSFPSRSYIKQTAISNNLYANGKRITLNDLFSSPKYEVDEYVLFFFGRNSPHIVKNLSL